MSEKKGRWCASKLALLVVGRVRGSLWLLCSTQEYPCQTQNFSDFGFTKILRHFDLELQIEEAEKLIALGYEFHYRTADGVDLFRKKVVGLD